MPGLAAEAAFWLFFALIPLLAVAGLITARFAPQSVDVWLPFLAESPRATRELVTKQLSRVTAWNSGAVGPLAVVMFLWLASSGLHSLFDALQADLGRPRSWVQTRIAALLSCLVLAIGVAACSRRPPLQAALLRAPSHAGLEVGRLGPRITLGFRFRPGSLSAGSLGARAATPSIVHRSSHCCVPTSPHWVPLHLFSVPRGGRQRIPRGLSLHRSDTHRVVSLHALSSGGPVGEPTLQTNLAVQAPGTPQNGPRWRRACSFTFSSGDRLLMQTSASRL
jgi:hypothetical protein